MHATTTTAGHHPTHIAAWQWRWGRRALLAAGAVVVLIGVLIAAAFFIDEPLRRHMEAQLNQTMKGYSVRIPELDFHPLGFSLTLRGLRVSQKAHPEPPVVSIEDLDASVHWRALLHLRLVADFELTKPRFHINRAQLQAEAADKVPLKNKGWQEALEDIYPLKVNEFRVRDGSITYVEKDPSDAMKITDVNLVATNIRNVRSPDRTYPSPYHFDAVIFERGHLTVDGDANFMAEPQPGSRGRIELRDVPLQRLKPVSTQANIYVTSGTLDANGEFEYATDIQNVHLQQVTVKKLAVDYVHAPETALAEERRKEKVERTAKAAADHPTAQVVVDRFMLRDATLGYVDKTTTPDYRVFLNDIDGELRAFSNQPEAGPSRLTVTGKFMGSGATRLDATFLPRHDNPDLDLSLAIDSTDMRAMNDISRAYANFDVVGGEFSLYTQLHVKNGGIDGYIKPLFTNLDVYDRRQDSAKPILKQVYEGLVGGISDLLENRRDDVATETSITGSAKNPHTSTWQVVINLIRNAFFRAILPGFEQSIREHHRT